MAHYTMYHCDMSLTCMSSLKYYSNGVEDKIKALNIKKLWDWIENRPYIISILMPFLNPAQRCRKLCRIGPRPSMLLIRRVPEYFWNSNQILPHESHLNLLIIESKYF